MNTRSLTLYRIQFASLFHKVKHDLAGEIVVALCSAILAATFFYVFRDFIQEQVKQLSEKMFVRFAWTTGHIVLAVTAAALARSLRRTRQLSVPSLGQTARLLGEESSTLRTFQIAWQCTVAGLVILVGVAAGSIIIGSERFMSMLVMPGSIYLAVGLLAGFGPQWQRQKLLAQSHGPLARPPSLLTWRLKWWRRSRLAHLGIVLGVGAFTLAATTATGGLPAFVPAACVFAAGLLWAIPLTFQLAADLEVAWVERSLGVSHEQFFNTYSRLGMLIGGIAAVITTLILLLSGTAYSITEIISAAGAAATPALVEPAVMFQIDGRRPAITVMILVLVSVFVATAIIAHPLSLLLLPLIKYYAGTTQAGRFYRA